MTIHAALVDNRRWMFGYAMRLVGDRDAAGDIVQAACLTALTARNGPKGNVRSWLYGHVKNAWRTDAKAQSKHAALPLNEHLALLADGDQEYAADFAGAARRIAGLSEPWRSTCRAVAGGEAHSEYARRMGVARSTITMRINKVRPYVLHGTPLAA
jgi:DNA-directed RNA polymerase specialized sigma24 family protein